MKIYCQRCTMRCELEVCIQGEEIVVEGNLCRKGDEFGREEMKKNKRKLYLKLPVEGGYFKEVPVKSDGDIPSDVFEEVVEYLKGLQLHAPIEFGEVIAENVMETGVNVISDRKI